MRAVTAKTAEGLPHGLGLKHDDYPPGFGGGSAILDTYLQYIGENVFGAFLNCCETSVVTEKSVLLTGESIVFTGMNAAKLAQMNAMHMDRKTYDEPSPQMGSLPPPPTTLAHQRFLKQMQRQYTDNMGKPDIIRDSDEPLDLGKERQRCDSIGDADADKHELDKDAGKEYYGKYEEERRALASELEGDHSGAEEADYSEDEHNKTAAS